MKPEIIRLLKPIIEYFPTLAMTYRAFRDSRLLLEVPRNTPMGFMLVGHEEMQQGIFEPEETELVKKILGKVDVLLNVGANIGYYCCIALNMGKYVVAFEPMPHNLQYLLKNIKANNWGENIEIFPLALGNGSNILEMYGGGTMASLVKGRGGLLKEITTLIPISTIDLVLGSRFHGRRCLVLVDVEGAEKVMLEGANSLLTAEPKPIWMVEVSISEHQPAGISINPDLLTTFQMFWECGYEAWTADRQCRQVFPSEVENIVKSGRDTLLTHNFLFIEKGCKTELLDV